MLTPIPIYPSVCTDRLPIMQICAEEKKVIGGHCFKPYMKKQQTSSRKIVKAKRRFPPVPRF
jgi:hypothetical protein